MAKHQHDIATNEIEELVFYSDSEEQFASDDSGNDFTQDLSEDSDGIVEADKERHNRRDEDRAAVHHFSGPDPGLICVVAPNINRDSSSLDFFRLMLTAELFSTILTKTNHYYQRHTQKEEIKTLQTDITVYEIYCSYT
jgi:hypothetical protein